MSMIFCVFGCLNRIYTLLRFFHTCFATAIASATNADLRRQAVNDFVKDNKHVMDPDQWQARRPSA